ncbi:MAG: hypothetical protein V7768_08970, partial [Dietzia cercidiphylli]
MNKSTKAAAVAATAALAISGATGTASAQSALPDFGIIGDLLDPFTGSAGDLAGGSSGLSPLEGSASFPGSSEFPSSAGLSSD